MDFISTNAAAGRIPKPAEAAQGSIGVEETNRNAAGIARPSRKIMAEQKKDKIL
jgi:hypothetical protein